MERIETHASIVFLAGDRALKLKRAVRYDYLDFRRRSAAQGDVRGGGAHQPAHRPALPRGDRGDARAGLRWRSAAPGPVEWVIEMARFDQADLFDRLAAAASCDSP